MYLGVPEEKSVLLSILGEASLQSLVIYVNQEKKRNLGPLQLYIDHLNAFYKPHVAHSTP